MSSPINFVRKKNGSVEIRKAEKYESLHKMMFVGKAANDKMNRTTICIRRRRGWSAE